IDDRHDNEHRHSSHLGEKGEHERKRNDCRDMSQALTLTGEVKKFAIVEPIHERNSFAAIIRKLRRSVAGFLPLPMIKLGIMQPSLEKLRKFFRLEHENKYQNTAIIGGLAKMLDYWEGEARADNVTEEVIQAVVAR